MKVPCIWFIALSGGVFAGLYQERDPQRAISLELHLVREETVQRVRR